MIRSFLIASRGEIAAALLLAFAIALPGAAQALPDELQINDDSWVRPRSAAGMRRALVPCLRAGACQSVYLETCQMCIMFAQAEGGGFTLRTRLGPPGPEYDLYDNRAGRNSSRVFAAAEMIEIMARYLSGPGPRYVGTIQVEDETTQ